MGSPMLLSEIVRDRVPDDAWQSYMLHFDAAEGCGFQGCDVEDLKHWHCKDDGCEMVFRHEDGVRDHGRNHFIQDQISDLFFVRENDDESDSDSNKTAYHCKWVSFYVYYSQSMHIVGKTEVSYLGTQRHLFSNVEPCSESFFRDF